jgi:hypothetical protein
MRRFNEGHMRIHVVAEDGISPQAQTYAEYRLFAALSQLVGTERVSDAGVILRHAKPKHGGQRVSCMVTVSVDGADTVRLRAIGGHAYEAINRAIERLNGVGASPLRHEPAMAGAAQ